MTAGRLIGLALALSTCAAAAGDDPAGRAHQEGLYLQLTRGDLPAALEAYGRALQAGGAEPTAALLLDQARCLEWSGDQARLQGVLALLRERGPGPDTAATLPAESDLIVELDLKRLFSVPPFDRFSLVIDRAIRDRFLANSAGALGLSVSRLTLAVSLGVDGHRSLIHWVLRLDGDFDLLKPPVLERLVRELAVELARAKAGVDVRLETQAGGAVVMRLEPACCPGAPPSAILEVRQIYGRSVTLARVHSAGLTAGVLELGLARLKDGALLLGERRALERTLAAEAQATVGLRANRRLWGITARVPPDSGLWMALSPDEIIRQVRKVQTVLGWGGALPEVTGLMLTGRWGEGLELSAVAWTSNTEAANSLADLARGGLALLRLTAAADVQQSPALKAVVDGLRVEVEGRKLLLQATLPAAKLQEPAAPPE